MANVIFRPKGEQTPIELTLKESRRAARLPRIGVPDTGRRDRRWDTFNTNGIAYDGSDASIALPAGPTRRSRQPRRPHRRHLRQSDRGDTPQRIRPDQIGE